MNYWHDVSLGDKYPKEFNAIIEIPRGSANKYEVDKKTGLIKLDRVNHVAMYYPTDYGFIPRTYWYDDDPLDVMVLTTHKLVPGLLVECRPVALIEMIDDGDSDSKIIAVPVENPYLAQVRDLKDVYEHKIKEIKHFFESYKQLQNKEVKVTGVKGRKEAIAVLEKARELYQEKFKK